MTLHQLTAQEMLLHAETPAHTAELQLWLRPDRRDRGAHRTALRASAAERWDGLVGALRGAAGAGGSRRAPAPVACVVCA